MLKSIRYNIYIIYLYSNKGCGQYTDLYAEYIERKHAHDDLHVLYGDVFEDLTVVHVPHGLIIPHFRRQQNGSQDDPLPVSRTDINLSVG